MKLHHFYLIGTNKTAPISGLFIGSNETAPPLGRYPSEIFSVHSGPLGGQTAPGSEAFENRK